MPLLWGRGPPKATAAAPAAGPCFTHHEIVELIEPFAAHGYRVNMAGSDRLARSLVFHTVSVTRGDCDGVASTLQLDSPGAGRFRVTRSLSPAGEPVASLRCDGASPADLVQRVSAFDVRRQFAHGTGYSIAWQLHLAPDGSTALVAATALLECATMTMTAPQAGQGRASVEIRPHQACLKLPEDLFAVLGHPWSLMQREGTTWRFNLRLRDGDAQPRFECSTRHLVQTLRDTPQGFHQRHLTARWAVSLRRSLLLAAWLTLLILVVCAQPLSQVRASAWPLLLASLPVGLLWWCFRLEEMPRLRLPRRPLAPDWARWQEPER